MQEYPVKLAPDGDGFIATFRDIPEAITAGDTKEEAVAMATDALITAMDFYFEDNRPVPAPSVAQAGEALVELPASVAIKVMLLNEMLNQHVRPVQLAARLNTSKSTVTRLLDITHTTKLDSLQKAFAALNKKLSFTVE